MVNILQERQEICLSSSDATTCCIVALNCSVTGLCGIAHFGQILEQQNCLSPLLEGLIAPELYIVGGFCEATTCGVATAHTILRILEDSHKHINVQLACIGEVNTTHDGAPRCRSFALTRSAISGRVLSKCAAYDKGPAAPQRLARVFARGASGYLENVYDSSRQLMRISHISSNMSRQHVSLYAVLLHLSDADLLNQLSTSPQHEEASFVPGVFSPDA